MLIFGAVFNTAAIAGVRFLWRLVLTMRNAKANKPEDNTPLLIVGAGNAGAWAVNLCKTKNQSFGNPVCIVDDDLTKKGLRVQAYRCAARSPTFRSWCANIIFSRSSSLSRRSRVTV